MHLKVKELKGSEVTYSIESTDTILSLKKMIEEQTRIPLIEIKLLLAGKILQDEKTIESYQITESSKIMLTRTKVDLKSLLQKSLSKFYDTERAARISELVVASVKRRAQELSLDDIERISESWNKK